jgi:predicted CXXCH cytochrome family protein
MMETNNLKSVAKRRFRFGVVAGAGLLLAVVLFFWWLPVATAVPLPLQPVPADSLATLPLLQVSDLSCRLCHSDSDKQIDLPSGEALPVEVDFSLLAASVHGRGEAPVTCVGCHQPQDEYQYPHAPVTAVDLRAYQVKKSATCASCHQPHVTSHPGPGTKSPVLCTDCHTGHEVISSAEWREGAGVESCLSCHSDDKPERLTSVIGAGLFSAELSDETCLACHSQPGLSLTLANGDVLSLTINGDEFHNSVHGEGNEWQPLECASCHGEYPYPHPAVTAAGAREYALERYVTCAGCHEQNYDKTLDSVHGEALLADKREAAICTDCHGAHYTPPPDEPRLHLSQMCEQCHTTAYEEYAVSVHGAALSRENNPDVPTCIDCHGVHNINDPTTALFRVRSPQLCAGCHADNELMAKYEISTAVFNTYVSDFHGTTVTLFEHTDPDVETNKAVCYDCHSVHAIMAPDDPEAGIKANLLVTCQQCHPDATENFPDSWTSHFPPSLEHNSLVYMVNLFYQFLIPAVLGLLSFLVLTDVYRRIRLRVRRPVGGEL